MKKKNFIVIIIVLVILVTILISFVDYLIRDSYIYTEGITRFRSELNLDYHLRNILYFIFVIIAAISGFILIRRGMQEKEVSRKIFDGYGFFLLGLSGNRAFFLFNDLGIMASHLAVDQSTLIGYSISLFTSLVLIIMMEKSIFHLERKIVSKIILVLAILSGFIAVTGFFIEEISMLTNIVKNIIQIVAFLLSIIIMLLYLKLMITISIKNKRLFWKTFGIFLGITLFFLGSFLDGSLLKSIFTYPFWIPPIFSIIGILFILYNQLTAISREDNI